MSPDPAPAHREEPLCYAHPPGAPQVQVWYEAHITCHPGVAIQYCGEAEDLIAAGVATAAMLVMNPPIGRRAKRVDQDGDAFRLVRYWRSSRGGQECEPYRYFRLTRLKPERRIGELPGAREAIAAYNRYQKWAARNRRGWEEVEEVRVPAPKLRLVVDNTR
jgi:hypothetical protein